MLAASLVLGARPHGPRLLLRYRPTAGDLSRVETEMTRRMTGQVVSGPTTTGDRRFATVTVASDSAGIVRLRVQIDSDFALTDYSVTAMPGRGTTLSQDLRWDDRRRRLPPPAAMPDSLLAEAIESSLFGLLFPFPDDSVARGQSWQLKLPFVLPSYSRDQGLVQATVTMKVKDLIVTQGDTVVVLGVNLKGQGRMQPAAQSGVPFAVSARLEGEERYALDRGITTDLELHGSYATDLGMPGGLHIQALEEEVRISRRLLVNP